MARHLVQLKLASERGSLRPDAPDRPGTIVGLIVILALAIAALAVAAVVWGRDAEVRGAVGVIGGTVLAIGAFLVSASARQAEAVDPRALVFAGRSPGRAAAEAALSSAVGPAPLALGIVLLVWVALWRDDPLAVAVAAAGAVVSFALAIVLGRLGALVGSVGNERRIAGDLASAGVLVGLLAAAPLAFLLVTAPWQHGAGAVATGVAEALAWSPFGGAWAAPATIARGGAPLEALAQLGLSLAALIVLVAAWQVLGAMLAAGRLARPRRQGELDLGLLSRVGRTPARAIAARVGVYWLRDRRYRLVLLVVIAVPALALVPLALVGVPPQVLALIPVPLLGFFFGWSLHNDLAFDSTALWLHITAAMNGRSDRLGRALPTLLVGGALTVLGSATTGLITGDWPQALAVLGVSLCLLFASAGISSVTSVLFPYAVARPGDSPYSQPVRTWGAGVWMHPLAGVVAIVAAGPAIALLVVGTVTSEWWWHVAAFGAGVVVGVAVLAWGIAEGGRRYERRSSELMTFATSA